jgi:hypothetical protein
MRIKQVILQVNDIQDAAEVFPQKRSRRYLSVPETWQTLSRFGFEPLQLPIKSLLLLAVEFSLGSPLPLSDAIRRGCRATGVFRRV